jgi:hypothetical protein
MRTNAPVEAEVIALDEDAKPPFYPLSLNAETAEAMNAARQGELTEVGSVESLLADLHADD